MNGHLNAPRSLPFPGLTAVIVAAGVLAGPQIAGAQAPPFYAPLHSFTGGGNRGPSSLIRTSERSSIGTTSSGGAAGAGTIFQMSPTGDGAHVRVLHTFSGATEGAGPETALLEGPDVTFYGTAQAVKFMLDFRMNHTPVDGR